MNIAELTSAVSAKTGLSKTDAEAIVRQVFDEIAIALKNGEEVKIANFGSFEKKVRAARTGRNPITGETISIPATNQVGFKASKHLKDSL
jgi:DNA-binding protein HU-beta